MRAIQLTLFFFFLLFQTSISWAQDDLSKLSGQILDSAKNPIESARVLLVLGKDSLYSSSNKQGEFSFQGLKHGKALLEVSYLGFDRYHTLVDLRDKQHDLKVILKVKAIEIEEIVLKKKPNPIRVMQDTVEFNAEAFDVFKGDNVADLMKQFPGMEIDNEYNVKMNEKPIFKLRVNGVDFFTGNVKEFISKLPAEIVSKIQVIDDYGEQANFTGEKTGEPTALLNIETKQGMDRGKFGSSNAQAGTNQQIGLNLDFNSFNKAQQRSAHLGYVTQNNGAGTSNNFNGGLSFRNKFKEKGNLGINYSSYFNESAFFNENFVETVNAAGTYYNSSNSRGKNGLKNHSLNLNLSNVNEKWFYNLQANLGVNRSNNSNQNNNDQTGVLKQGFRNATDNNGSYYNGGFNLQLTRKTNGGKNHISSNFSYQGSRQSSLQSIQSNTLYFDQEDGRLLKDSVLNRNIDNLIHAQQFSMGSSYTLGFGKPKEGEQKRNSLTFRYNLSFRQSNSKIQTQVQDPSNQSYFLVDSLSSDFQQIMLQQLLGTNYNYNDKKVRLTFGLNLQPISFRNSYAREQKKFARNSLNFSPTFNLSRMYKTGKILSLNYAGRNNTATDQQLQPIRNTQNLQNIVVGNPNLKSYFQHNLSGNYNLVGQKTGRSMMISVNASGTQDEIVMNTIIIPDTLGSYRRETRYENANGTFNVGSNYNFNFPFKDKKFSISYNGTIGFSNKLLMINSEKYFNKGLNFSQNVNSRYKFKKVIINGRLGFSQANNNNIGEFMGDPGNGLNDPTFNIAQFTSPNFFRTRSFFSSLEGNLMLKNYTMNFRSQYVLRKNENPKLLVSDRVLHNIDLATYGTATLFKDYQVNYTVSKVFNKGYSIANQNPLLINMGVSRTFLKDKTLALWAEVNDLLNQGNMLSRQVSGNSIIDTRSNLVTRVFSLRLTYSLSRYGDNNKHIQVDPDLGH